MNYSEEEVITILKVQIANLKRLGDLNDSMALEISRHRSFIRQMLLAMKKLHDQEGSEDFPGTPDNILKFPFEKGE